MLNRWSAAGVSVTRGDSTTSGTSADRRATARQCGPASAATAGSGTAASGFRGRGGPSTISAVTKEQRPRRVESCETHVGLRVRNVATISSALRLPGQRDSLPPTVLPGERGFRTDIEGLRAVAVLLVVAGHVGLPGLAGGYVGV